MVPANTILCGDARVVLTRLPAGCVALTVTSPAYFRHRDYAVTGQIGQEATVVEYVDRLGEVLRELFRVTADTAVASSSSATPTSAASSCSSRIGSGPSARFPVDRIVEDDHGPR
jgi:hypothetical protein